MRSVYFRKFCEDRNCVFNPFKFFFLNITVLNKEKQELIRRRDLVFEVLDIPCELKYEFEIIKDYYLSTRECIFYVEVDGHRQIFVKCSVYCDESPDDMWIRKVPEKYRNAFLMLWRKAHKEEIDFFEEEAEKRNRAFEKEYKETLQSDINKSKEFLQTMLSHIGKEYTS